MTYPGAVNVPLQMDCVGTPRGADLVAYLPVQSNLPYNIHRLAIANGPQTNIAANQFFRAYKNSIGINQFAFTSRTDNNTAQLVPAEYIPPNCELFFVWEGQAAYSGVARITLTTDGGIRP